MSTAPDPKPPRLTLEALARIDEVCTQFEEARQKGQDLTIEQLVAGVEGPKRQQLLLELLLIDFAQRSDEDLDQMEADYRMRLPKDGGVIQLAVQKQREQYERRHSSNHTVMMSSPAFQPANEDVLPESNGEEPKRVRYFGEYEILDEIARGGMGVVFKARQKTLKRTVALKMIITGRLADQAEIDRFKREAQAASRLQHPHIVAIHEIGEHKGRHYFTMNFIDGSSLADVLREETLAPVRAANLVRTISEAVHYAHGQGTVHRDLKPANMLLSKSGTPHVTDFGLAKVFDERDADSWQRLTETGQVVGTPSYMSPEQAAGKIELVGPASDIWSLGAVLYACLTGRPPFLAETQVETIMQVMHKEPVAPRELNPAVPKDLETICLKCLNKEPHKRYGTAQELADDLQRFVEGRPVLARPVGRSAKLLRWAKRNPVVASLTGLSALLLISGTGISSYFAVEAHNRAEYAEKQEVIAEEQEGIARTALADAQASEKRAKKSLRETYWHLYKAQLFPMKEAWENQEFGQLKRLLDASVPEEGEPDFRGWEWYFFQDEVNRRFTTITPQESKFVYVEWSSDGMWLAFRREDKAIEIRDGNDYSLKYVLPGSKQTLIAWQPNSHLLAVAARDREVEIWNIDEKRIIDTLFTPGTDATNMQGRGLAWSRDGTRIALGGYRRIDIWSWSGKGQHQKALHSLGTWVSTLDWHPDGDQLGAGGLSYAASIDIEKDRLNWKRFHNRVRVFDVEWDAEGHRLATSWDWPAWMIRVFDVDGKETSLEKHNGSITALQWISNSNALISVNPTQAIRFWDMESHSLSREYHYHSSAIRGLASNSNNGLFVTIDASSVARVWRTEQPPTEAEAVSLPSITTHVEWNSKGDLVACCSSSIICVLDSQLKQYRTIDSHESKFANYCWHPTQPLLAIQDQAGRVTVINVISGETVFDQKGSSWDFNNSLAWSPNGRYLAAGSGMSWYPGDKGGVDIWELESGDKICVLDHKRTRTRVAWSPDSQQIAVASFSDQKLHIWNVAEREIATEVILQKGTWQIDFSPDGHFVAANLLSGPLTLIDVETGAEVKQLEGHSAHIENFSWSPDGSRIMTCSGDRTLRLWDAGTGEELIALELQPAMAAVSYWTPDSCRIATISQQRILQFWGSSDLKVPETVEYLEDGILAPSPQLSTSNFTSHDWNTK